VVQTRACDACVLYQCADSLRTLAKFWCMDRAWQLFLGYCRLAVLLLYLFGGVRKRGGRGGGIRYATPLQDGP